MKKMGRNHRPFFRVCAIDIKRPRDGKVIEELGLYDPLVKDTDARAILNGERIAYWLSVGATPSHKVSVLIKKYGKDGTHLAAQQAALERIKTNRPQAPAPYIPPPKPPEPAAEAPAEAAAEQPAESAAQ
jgi:small subunit ribosomal protein S16